MSELSNESCEACRADAPRLSATELDALMEEIPKWQAVEIDGEKRLVADFSFDNFKDALDFTQTVGLLAEEYQHHPQIVLEWGHVKVYWWTHKINGLHKNDVIMAAKTDKCFVKEPS